MFYCYPLKPSLIFKNLWLVIDIIYQLQPIWILNLDKQKCRVSDALYILDDLKDRNIRIKIYYRVQQISFTYVYQKYVLSIL